MSAADAARVYSRVGRVPALDAASAPLARCGHSLTACLGENSRKLILFGGATALENSSSGGGATGIRLAGATADVHCFDIRSGAWTKLAPEGEAPSPRAAHAAAAVGSMVVVQARARAAGAPHRGVRDASARPATPPGRHRARWAGDGRPVRPGSGEHAALAPRGAPRARTHAPCRWRARAFAATPGRAPCS